MKKTVEKYPEYLYQYTTIETLALILKNKTIRFNSLKNVDDMEEMQSEDIGNYGKFSFVSCWTDDEKENLALWNMYAGRTHGIRIKLPTHCFVDNEENVVMQVENKNLDVLITCSETFDTDTGISTEYNPFFAKFYHLRKVEYTDDESKIEPQLFRESRYLDENNRPNIHKYFNDTELGSYKRKEWEFQKEWRYIIITKLKGINHNVPNEDEIRKIEEFDDIPEGIYVKIDEDKLEEMEVLLGPGTSEADRIIVEALIDKYNPKMSKPKTSYFKDKIKNS